MKEEKPKLIKVNQRIDYTQLRKDKEERRNKYLPKYTTKDLIRFSITLSIKQWKYLLYIQIFKHINMYFFNSTSIQTGKLIDCITKYHSYEKLYEIAYETIYQSFIIIFVRDYFLEIIKYVLNLNDNIKQFEFIEMIFNKDLEYFDFYSVNEIKEQISHSGQGDFNYITLCIDYYYVFMYLGIIIIKLKKISISLVILGVFLFFFQKGFFYLTMLLSRCLYSNNPTDDISSLSLHDFITNIRLIKTFGKEKEALKSYSKTKEFLPGIKNNSLVCKYFLSFLNFISANFYNIRLFLVGILVINGKISYGDYIVSRTLFNSFQYNLSSLLSIKSRFTSLSVSLGKIYQQYNYPNKVVSLKNIIPSTPSLGKLSFSNVIFSYPFTSNTIVLNNLSMTIPSGKLCAIVGHSGGGKTTIAKLIQRFYDPEKGEIMLDDINIKDYNIEWYRHQIGYVEQEPPVLSGNIEENITYGVKEYTEEEFKEVCHLSGVNEFATNRDIFPDGYKTLVGERGIKISGGQKQRIAIGRALMRKAKILILDEATSALDAEMEDTIRESIEIIRRKRKITIIIIAHRLSTIKKADVIMYLDKGKVIEEGTHDELIKMNGKYKQSVENQLIR